MDLSETESKLGPFLSDPSCFTKSLNTSPLTMTLLGGRSISFSPCVLTRSYEKDHIIQKAREIADSMHHQNNNIHSPGESAVPTQDPNWNDQTQPQPIPDHLGRDHMVNCLLQGTKAPFRRLLIMKKLGKSTGTIMRTQLFFSPPFRGPINLH